MPKGKVGYPYLEPVFQILNILRQIWILGSVHWITNPDLNPAPDPDPALFISGFQDINKNIFFPTLFYLFLTVGTVNLHQFSKITSLRSHKTVKVKVFLNCFASYWKDPDPGSPKTYESYGSGSGSGSGSLPGTTKCTHEVLLLI